MNPSSKTPIIIAAVLVAAVVTGTIAMRGRADPANSATPPADVATEVTPSPATRGQHVQPRTAAQLAGDTGQALANRVDVRAKRRDEQIARTAALKRQSAERFASEQVDPAWAPQKEAELTGIAGGQGFETAGVKPTSMRMDCKSSMCKIDGQFASNGEAEDWILIYMSSVGSAMPSSMVSRTPNPDGTTRVEIYGRAR